MASVIRLLRTSAAGRRPTTDARYPGQPYVNFADRQLGVLNSSGVAVDFLAVRYHLDTANYAAGDFVIYQGAIYKAKSALTPKAFTASDWDKHYTQAEVDALVAHKQTVGIYKSVIELAAARALVATDIGCLLYYTNTPDATFTTPNSASLATFPVGCRIDFVAGVGRVIFAAGSGTSIISAKSFVGVTIGGAASLTRMTQTIWQLAGALE